jgi:hypothetical protein
MTWDTGEDTTHESHTTTPSPEPHEPHEPHDPSPVHPEPRHVLSRLAIVYAVAVGVLVVAFVGVVVALNMSLYSASGYVKAYLGALERGDVQAALAFSGVEAQGGASDALLRGDMMAELTDVEIVDDENMGGGMHHVLAEYRVGGRTAQTMFVVEHTGPRLLFFNSWTFAQSPLTTLDIVPRNAVEFDVNGSRVLATAPPGEPSTFAVLVPSALTIHHESLYLESEKTTLLVTEPRPEPFVLEMFASDAFEQAVHDELSAYLDECAAQQVLFPTGCPFGKSIADRLDSAPSWTIVEYPSVTIVPGPQMGTWIMKPTAGTANLKVEVRSQFDGRVSQLDEDIRFTVSYLVTFTEDGGLTLTPL